MTDDNKPCPCRSGERFADCCAPLLAGDKAAATATQLMRSRFTAFAVGDADHLVRTWHPDDRPATLDLDEDRRWTFLDVVASTAGGLFDSHGTVEFVAHYRSPSERGSLHEVSRFVREDGEWLYAGSVGRPEWSARP